MHNQHAGLRQLLAAQRITDRHDQAAHVRLAHSGRRSRPLQALDDPWLAAAGPLAKRRHPPGRHPHPVR